MAELPGNVVGFCVWAQEQFFVGQIRKVGLDDEGWHSEYVLDLAGGAQGFAPEVEVLAMASQLNIGLLYCFVP